MRRNRLILPSIPKLWLRVLNADSGLNLSAEADLDRATLLDMHLPEEWQGRGEQSGRQLRELQCQALAFRRLGGTGR